MAENLAKFSSGPMARGISPRTPDFQTDVELSIDTINMSQGVEQGLSVRCGMSPIPGQNDNETGTLNPRLPGLLMAEGGPGLGLKARTKVLGWVQLSLPSPSDITQKQTVYGAIVTTTDSGGEFMEVALCSTWTGSVEQVSTFIYDGFGEASYFSEVTGNTAYSFLTEGLIAAGGSKAQTTRDYLTFDTNTFYASSATINVSGINVPTKWLFGVNRTNGDATHAPSVGFFINNGMEYPGGGASTTTLVAGIPSEYQLQNFTKSARALIIHSLTVTGDLNIQYEISSITPSTSTWKQDLLEVITTNLDLSGTTAVKKTSGTTYSATGAVLVNDSAAVSNSSFSAVAVAAKKPYLCLFQGPYRCGEGKFNQWFDLVQNVFQPPAVFGGYTEDGVSKATSFAGFDVFITGEAYQGFAAPYGSTLLAADSGVLRSDTTYELTYSVYNKRLNFETNVGVPVKFNTGADDFVGFQIWNSAGAETNQNQYGYWQTTGTVQTLPFAAGNFLNPTINWYGGLAAINFIEYRFYYRQLGTFEWLPAGNIDAAQFWFDPYLRLNICTGPVAATPGGQPGGFNDYSPLPADNYNCVVQYKNRFFWFSDQACVFSLSNNPFAYAARNSISASTGKFLGGIVHNYPGQADQSSRLVIFGTTGNYVARFTGLFQQTQVQVAADASATFNIEGSDLVIDPWTSVTAFSYRTAVIADGILYYWGPQGVYRDDGVNTPTKISGDLEPYIFTLYDPTKTADMHGHYDDLTKEITWYYTAKNNTTYPTRTLVYNTLSQEFLPGAVNAQIDWIQNLNIESNILTGGKRSTAGIRFTAGTGTQRSYFFDNRNRSGEMYPKGDWLIKSVATPAAGTRRLTLAAGYDATNFATIAVGDYLALQQAKDYLQTISIADDMIAVISAVNTGSGYIDITLPANGNLQTVITPTFNDYFPFWTMTPTSPGLNGIAYQMKTVYWTPAGINGYFFWLYWYLLAKYIPWATDLLLGWNLSYRSPTSLDFLTDHVVFDNNSDDNYQIYHPLAPGNDNHEGQGLKLVVAGNHIGPEWVLQYMEIHGKPVIGDMLKRFEG